MSKVDCIIIWNRKEIEIQRLDVKDGRVQVSGAWKPQFQLSDFLSETITKHWFEVWKRSKGRSFLILREGFEKAIEPQGAVFDDIWTQKEAKELIKKLIAQSVAAQKPFTNWQLIPILLMMGVSIVLSLLIINRIGI